MSAAAGIKNVNAIGRIRDRSKPMLPERPLPRSFFFSPLFGRRLAISS
jgi:hypothetical protein